MAQGGETGTLTLARGTNSIDSLARERRYRKGEPRTGEGSWRLLNDGKRAMPPLIGERDAAEGVEDKREIEQDAADLGRLEG